MLRLSVALGLYTSTGILADIEVECTDDAGEDEWGMSNLILSADHV